MSRPSLLPCPVTRSARMRLQHIPWQPIYRHKCQSGRTRVRAGLQAVAVGRRVLMGAETLIFSLKIPAL